jgi:DDE superfamily endonuclease
VLDGTHIPIHMLLKDQPQYQNRKGTLSQNVLAVCNFDMCFVYVLAGWEGSAHDGKVLQDAQGSQGFDTPKGKYWLGDAGYGCTEHVLTPYRGVRYHLKKQKLAGQTPENAKELFNLQHASLRNVIEQIFGILKRKFKILGTTAEYSIDTQIHLVISLVGLYNFICIHEGLSKEELDEVDRVLQRDVQGDNSNIRRSRVYRNGYKEGQDCGANVGRLLSFCK